MSNFFFLLFTIPLIRKYLHSAVAYPQWDKYLIYIRNYSGILLGFGFFAKSQAYTIELLWDLIYIFLIYFLYQIRSNRVARVLLMAAIPLVSTLIIEDLLIYWTPKFFNRYEDEIDLINIVAFIWMVAFGFGAANQHKAFLAEQKRREEEEYKQKLLEEKRQSLEYQVAERTAELTKQKEELEKALKELQLTQNQLIQSEKLASLGELTAGIAHEIQNPLNFVNNFSELSVELIAELGPPPPEGGVYETPYGGWESFFTDLSLNLEKISHHGKRASSIVKGMLQHSRMTSGDRELTDINHLVDEYLRLSYHGLRAKNKTFNADYELITEENLPMIKIVPQDIGRVILNLINNAFYAANLRKNQQENHQPKVTVKTQTEDNFLIVSVKDNGVGMDEETQAKIFQPFFTTKPTGEGTGLGLSLSYEIVTKGYGGILEVQSNIGEGATFVVKLPI